MRTVYKYTLDKHFKTLQLPLGYKILSVVSQNDVIQLYCLVDKGNREESVDFSVIGTGWDLEESGVHGGVEHVGTVTTSSGVYVWHVFRHINEKKQNRWTDNKKIRAIQEIKNSLPSRRMFEVTSVSAVMINDELLYLKNRYEYEPAKESFIFYDELHDIEYDYNELHNKNVIFSRGLLSERGLEAIYELERMED